MRQILRDSIYQIGQSIPRANEGLGGGVGPARPQGPSPRPLLPPVYLDTDEGLVCRPDGTYTIGSDEDEGDVCLPDGTRTH